MKRVQGSVMDDLFEIPLPDQPTPGSSDYAFQVANLVGNMLKECPLDRYEISAQMSRLTDKDVSKNMLDAWSSAGRPDHNIPLYLVPVLESVCTNHVLTDWLARIGGGRVAFGRETLKAKMATALLKKQKADQEFKQLQKMLEGDA